LDKDIWNAKDKRQKFKAHKRKPTITSMTRARIGETSNGNFAPIKRRVVRQGGPWGTFKDGSTHNAERRRGKVGGTPILTVGQMLMRYDLRE